MEIRVIEKDAFTLAGMVYYGPLTGEGWSSENPIGQLWQRFNQSFDKHGAWVAAHAVNPRIGYEVNIFNEEEFQETKRFYTFVGVEVDGLDDLPFEMVGKFLPASSYAHAIPRGAEIRSWEHELYEDWLPASGFQLLQLGDYGYQLQVYEEGRFKGPGEQLAESEIDVFVPVTRRA
jgi:predicted transcriptional regulator YdeE